MNREAAKKEFGAGVVEELIFGGRLLWTDLSTYKSPKHTPCTLILNLNGEEWEKDEIKSDGNR